MKSPKTMKQAVSALTMGARIFKGSFTGWWLQWGKDRVRISSALVTKLVEADVVRRVDDGGSQCGVEYVGRSLTR